MSRSVDFGAEERRKKSTDSRIGENITNTQIIIYVILTYNFSDLNPHILFYIFLFSHHVICWGDQFTEVTRDRKKCKALRSPMLPSQHKSGSSEPPLGSPVNPKSSLKNKIPVIISGVDEKFKNWRQLLGELRQYHPSLRIDHIKELPKGDFLIIGDSVQDMIILQSESKMKAALGQKVKVSLPKAFQINKAHTKILVVKGVPTDITESEFKEFLDINEISYAKAE